MNFSAEKFKLEKKLIAERGEKEAMEVIAAMERASKEVLEEKLLDLSKTGQGLINTKNADTDLQNLKDKVREASRVHNENIRRNKDHQRLVSIIMSERFNDELMDVKEKSETDSNEEDSN